MQKNTRRDRTNPCHSCLFIPSGSNYTSQPTLSVKSEGFTSCRDTLGGPLLTDTKVYSFKRFTAFYFTRVQSDTIMDSEEILATEFTKIRIFTQFVIVIFGTKCSRVIV